MRYLLPLFAAILFAQCERDERYKILGNIEEPQNEIAATVARILNEKGDVRVEAVAGQGSFANIDSLEAGVADLAIVDNHAPFNSKVSAVMPLYSQVLHILCRRGFKANTLGELLTSGKIFAGLEGSGTRSFVMQLIADLSLDESRIQFVDVLNLFDADVIFSFTDLLTQDELRDLAGFELFSIDAVENLGKGSLVEGICARYPPFEPFVLPREVYGPFTKQAIVTIKVDALLVCRRGLDRDKVYSFLSTIHEHRSELQKINSLLYHVSGDFDPSHLTFALHPGAEDFIRRDEPSFIERYAEVFSVFLSVVLTIGSSLYTVSRWQKARKKNKIDVFYQRIMTLRQELSASTTVAETIRLEQELVAIQEKTVELVVEEKLLADESFSIFLNLSRIVLDEIRQQRAVAETKLAQG